MHSFVAVERRTANRGVHHHCVQCNREFIDQEYQRIFEVDDRNQVHIMKFCDECRGQ